MQTSHRADRSSNHLLEALPAADRDRWFNTLTPAFVATRRVLFEPAQAMEFVYFPLDAIISLLAPLESGVDVEVATVGNEGIAGVPPLHGSSLAVRAVCQVGGWVLRLETKAFLEAVNGSPAVSGLVGEYLQSLYGQVSQATTCHRLHSNEERLARWLLIRQDRVGLDAFPITHEFIAEMLGSRRTTVTVASRALQQAGVISNHRGVVTIIDRAGLEGMVCECYGIIAAEIASAFSADLRGHDSRTERVRSQQRRTAAQETRHDPGV